MLSGKSSIQQSEKPSCDLGLIEAKMCLKFMWNLKMYFNFTRNLKMKLKFTRYFMFTAACAGPGAKLVHQFIQKLMRGEVHGLSVISLFYVQSSMKSLSETVPVLGLMDLPQWLLPSSPYILWCVYLLGRLSVNLAMPLFRLLAGVSSGRFRNGCTSSLGDTRFQRSWSSKRPMLLGPKLMFIDSVSA